VSASTSSFYLFMIIYLVIILALNLVAYLISDFYRRKFNQPSPRLGFVAAVFMGSLFLLSLLLFLFVPIHSPVLPFVKIAMPYFLLGSGMMSIYSSVSLFFTMKRVRR